MVAAMSSVAFLFFHRLLMIFSSMVVAKLAFLAPKLLCGPLERKLECRVHLVGFAVSLEI